MFLLYIWENLSNLESKTLPKELLDFLPLAFMLPT